MTNEWEWALLHSPPTRRIAAKVSMVLRATPVVAKVVLRNRIDGSVLDTLSMQLPSILDVHTSQIDLRLYNVICDGHIACHADHLYPS